MNISEFIGFAGLLVTIITGIVFPFIQRPAINYLVSDVAQDGVSSNTYKIDILNYGIETANNVVVSLGFSNGSLKSLVSEPYLSTGFTKDNATSSNDTAFAKIGVLPPSGSVTIHLEVEGPLQPAARMLKYVYVSSDEAFGRETPFTILVITICIGFWIGALVAVYYLLWRNFFSPRNGRLITRSGRSLFAVV